MFFSEETKISYSIFLKLNGTFFFNFFNMILNNHQDHALKKLFFRQCSQPLFQTVAGSLRPRRRQVVGNFSPVSIQVDEKLLTVTR